MHDCPECGGTCSCDGEDHYQDAPETCVHECDEDDGDDELGFDQNDFYE